MQIKPLPPLKSLIAFTAAARHLSFTKASQDLHVTQGAISRQIKHLEDYLGQALFIRDNRSLKLTSVGSDYFHNIQQSLAQIASATGHVLQKDNDNQITIITSSSVASFWLLPRISQFQSAYPEIDLRLLAEESIANVTSKTFDIALFCCKEPPKNLQASLLFNEKLFPVCSPSYLAKIAPLNSPNDLAKATLLSLEAKEEWVTWPDWFSHWQVDYKQQNLRCININNYPLVIQAAINGQGLALAWDNLVDDYIASGLLVRPIANSLVTPSKFYILQPPKLATPKAAVECFRQWLLSII